MREAFSGRSAARFAAGAGAIGALALAASALAATPKIGCWGTCGGDAGPVGGFFEVQHSKVQNFSIELRCLGLQQIPQPIGSPATEGNLLEVPPQPAPKVGQPVVASIPIKAGKFSFTGKGERFQGKTGHKVQVALNGTFVTAKKVKVSLMVDYGSCGTHHFTIHYAG